MSSRQHHRRADLPSIFAWDASQDAVRHLFAAAPLGIGLFDCDLRYVIVNDALAAINGLSAVEHLGRCVADVAPDLHEQVQPVLEHVLSSGEAAVDVHVSGHTSANRSESREWLASFYRVGSDANPAGVGVVVADVTERRRAERRLRQLIDGLFTFVGLCDPDGVLTEANRTALDAAGIEPQDVVGRPFWDAYWWSYDPAIQQRLRDAIDRARSGIASRYDVDVRVKGGELLTIDFQLVPIIENGTVTALVPSGMDIADRRRSERQLESTALLARELSAARTTDHVINAVLRAGTAALGADFVSVALLDHHRVELFHPESLPNEIAERYRSLPLDATLPICDAIRLRSEVTVNDSSAHGGRYEQFFHEIVAAGFGHVTAVPLLSAGKVIGALGATWRSNRHRGVVDDSRMAIVAKLCAQTLSRTLRADRQEEFITTLQRHLLPTVPSVDGLDIAVSYQPSTEGIGFGGDWYDIVVLDEHRTAFIVGDIAGHGIEAAAEMAVVRSAINSLVRLRAPLEQVPLLAQAAVAPTDDRFIGTVAVAIVDTEQAVLEYVTAGHPAPAIRQPDGSSEFVRPLGNPPLGIAGDRSATSRVPFQAGSTLVMFTDGLIERRREVLDAGLSRLREALGTCDTTARSTMAGLRERLQPPDGTWSDDVALVVVRHIGRWN